MLVLITRKLISDLKKMTNFQDIIKNDVDRI